MGRLNIATVVVLCVGVAVFFTEFGAEGYQVFCRNSGVFGAGEADDCHCHYYFCVFYQAYNVWIRYPYNCSQEVYNFRNFTFDNVTMRCQVNLTATANG